MILQALAEYYERKVEEDEGALPPFGFERKEIPFLIVLDPSGEFVDFEDTREREGRHKRGRNFLVPQATKRTVTVKPNLLWDHAGYVFGVDTQGNPERAQEQQEAFVSAIRTLGVAEDVGVRAVLHYLGRADFAAVFSHPLWEEIDAATNANLSFRLREDRQLVCQRTAVRRAIAHAAGGDGPTGACLVSGEVDVVARLHPSIKGVWGAQSSGANIVSFNLDAFSSYGRSQGHNAPVGEHATFAYTTALNHLLRRDSPQRFQVGDASTVAWAERSHPFETAITAFFSETPKDDPDRGTEAIRALYAAPNSGAAPPTKDDRTRFYVLGLAPNASRIAVRFWHVSTVGELTRTFRQHFEDLRIEHAPFEPDVLPLWRLLAATAPQGKTERVRPNLAGAWVKTILEGQRYPRDLIAAAVQRNRAEREVPYERAALIKAYLARSARLDPHSSEPELSMSLDRTNPNPAYRLGRLFAVLERVQQAAHPGLNAGIRDRFYGAASTTPGTVFPRLLKLSNHHLSKLDSEGLRVFFEKEIGSIIGGIQEFPPLLALEDQGRFSIGYYHQRQDQFTKKNSDEGAAA